MKEGLIVMSLFDGMSCGQIALEELNIPVGYCYASETDKFAMQVTQCNFPATRQLGDITKWREWNIDWSKINLILAGSPCQGFSFAGKQLNFNDERSKLFFVFVDILNHVKKLNPDVRFLLENVIMKKEYQKAINDILGIFPIQINSALVSAQNRKRLYWTNIKIKKNGLFNEIHVDIPQPKDRGVLLKDILQLENEVDEKYYISDAVINRTNRKQYSKPKINPKKTGYLNTKNNSAQSSLDSGTTFIGIDINKKAPTQRSSTGRSMDKKHNYQIIKLDKQLNKKADQTKAGCFAGGGNSGGNHSDMDILYISEATKKGFTEINPDECIDLQHLKSKTRKGRRMKNKSNCLQASKTEFYKYTKDFKLRRLTPIECERLQTVPENYTLSVSDTQRYKMLGNGWTIEVIKHILSFL